MTKKRRRHTPDQIIRKLAEGNRLLAAGQELDEVCRHLETTPTWHRWVAQYGGMKASDAKRLKELEAENGDREGKLRTPNRQRVAVSMLRDGFGVSERRACRVVGQHRSTQRFDPPPISEEERRLREFLRAFSKRRPRWGWRRAAKAARKAGWRVNDKRIRRLWRDEGLRVPQRPRKKPLREIDAHVGAMCPIRPNALWALDFQFDHGPEFIANVVADWCRFAGTDSVFIDPGSPWQNAWIESFNGRFRDELLNGWQFDSLLEARVLIEDWRIDYNVNRPHTAHGELTPAEFIAQWTIKQPQAA